MKNPSGQSKSSPIDTRGFELADWQEHAVQSWIRGTDGQQYRGTLEIFTGGGKTLIALECCARAGRGLDLHTAVVVPTEALARQWVSNIRKFTDTDKELIGVLGAGSKNSFADKRFLVCVINTASKTLAALVDDPSCQMLIVDECHRAGAPTFSRVLDTPARFRLGLSATPDRDEYDDNGELLEYDDQLVGTKLGAVVYRFTLKQASEHGWLPDFHIHHHGVALAKTELSDYSRISRRIDDLADQLRAMGIEPERARAAIGRKGQQGRKAGAYVATTAKRKDLLYRAAERHRVVGRIVARVIERKPDARILLFHERVDEAVLLWEAFRESFRERGVALEHSRLPTSERQAALAQFRSGESRILVSVKSLVEGIDVPDADVGISVASSSSVRQRIQSLGRVLRRTFGASEETKQAEMHVVYVSDSVDDLIYAKENWSDLTGTNVNSYWRWPLDSTADGIREEGPPRTPLPTEEEEWERLGRRVSEPPEPWRGAFPSREYSIDTRRNVRTAAGNLVANPQDVQEMVAAVRGPGGGRFYVTPLHRLVLTKGADADSGLVVVGRLLEPLSAQMPGEGESFDPGLLRLGESYRGPRDKDNGTYKLKQTGGGVIERSVGSRRREYAAVDSTAEPGLVRNARLIISNWRKIAKSGMPFTVNRLWHAWYVEDGEARFLGEIPGGFAWPSEE